MASLQSGPGLSAFSLQALDPSGGKTHIFCHSHVPALNQLLVPFLTLVGMGELERNPTVKEEIAAAGLTNVNAAMYVYPVHQACDILFCQGNVVPVGRDQLPHIELTRKIARRFNQRFGDKKVPTFREGHALKHPDSDYVKQITKGGDGMPAFDKKLTPEQMTDLIKFIRHEFQGGMTPPAPRLP